MLHLYYGRERIDKDRFMFRKMEQLLERKKRVILMVPDQFTLQAEQNAFSCLGTDGLMDLEVLSQTRLATRVLEETGSSSRVHIDRYGRHMILAKILAAEEGGLEAFQGMKRTSSFIEMVNDLIIEFKQFNVSPDQLPEMLQKIDPDSLLYRKLGDIHKIYIQYEQTLQGKYVDTEDAMSLFISAVKKSAMIRNSQIWIAGFDSFTPKSELLLEQLMRYAPQVSVVLTSDQEDEERALPDRDLFALPQRVMKRMIRIAARNGVEWRQEAISQEFEIPKEAKSSKLAYLERTLFAFPYQHYSPQTEQPEGGQTLSEKEAAADPQIMAKEGSAAKLSFKLEEAPAADAQRPTGMAFHESIHFCRSANFYTEAETIAASICQLVRERGMRYRDIVVICNDMEGRGSVIRRVFEEYGIPAFIDQKRSIVHHAAVEFVISLLDIVQDGWQYEDVFRLLKTGLTDWTPEQWEEMENYAIKYRIRGGGWKKPFRYGVSDVGQEQLDQLNQMRQRLEEFLSQFEKSFRKEKEGRGRTGALYEFLREKAELPQRLEELVQRQTGFGEYEAAQESAQIWAVIINLLDQLVELIDDEKMSGEEFREMLKAGLEAVEIGLIPPTMDQVIVGTMQRTRTGAVGALFVAGANDGLLPMTGGSEELLSEDEKEILRRNQLELCKDDEYRMEEERLAIYRNLSKPSDFLWMGCSAADLEGKELRPSMIYDKVRTIFPTVNEEKDSLNQAFDQGADDLLIQRPAATLIHLTEAVRDCPEQQGPSDWWKAAYNWLADQHSPLLRPMEEGLLFENRQERLNRELTQRIYQKEGLDEFVVSPSRLERFSRCPFSHFIQYGLRPEERRLFQASGREVGDVYHECLKKLLDELTAPGVPITSPDSPWMKTSQADCRRRMGELMEQVSQEYREGLLDQGEEERYRVRRMKEVCGAAAWALISHVQQGNIRDVFLEAPFGRGNKVFPPIRLRAGEKTVRIEGKIDRVDILASENASYVKIIDYKSGKERFDVEEARGGWRLQLMIYLQAAMEGMKARSSLEGNDVKPAGVFYFEIAEPMIDATKLNFQQELGGELREKLQKEIWREFKLDGILLDDETVIRGIAGDLEEDTGFSGIAPVKKNKDGIFSGTSDRKLLTEEQFGELQEAVNQTVEELCDALTGGRLDILPKKTKTETACRFCPYRSICHFDVAFEGCRYQRV